MALGGLGNNRGAIIGGLALGLFQQAANFMVGGIFASVAVFAVFIIVLLAAPQGLFGAPAARTRVMTAARPKRRRRAVAARRVAVRRPFLAHRAGILLPFIGNDYWALIATRAAIYWVLVAASTWSSASPDSLRSAMSRC